METTHTMKTDSASGVECLHWTDQHTGDEVSTYGWLNTMTADYLAVVLVRAGSRSLPDAARWVDQRALSEGLTVEALCDAICEDRDPGRPRRGRRSQARTKLRRLMDEQGWTAHELSVATGLPVQTIARLASASRSSNGSPQRLTRDAAWSTVEALCRVLMCAPDALFEE